MDTRTAIEKAGGASIVSTACANRGMKITSAQITMWKARNRFPMSEWTGDSSVARVICDLIYSVSGHEIKPIELCPGSGQYMVEPEVEVDA